jgi:hypothetical protein
MPPIFVLFSLPVLDKTTESKMKSFLFRELPQNILIGTASDLDAGWIG